MWESIADGGADCFYVLLQENKGERAMQKKRILNLLLAMTCSVSLLVGCGGKTGPGTDDGSEGRSDHPVITMNAPYRNMSQFYDLVHEKYPEINLEITPYNGQNTSVYMKDMRRSGQMTDIYFTTYYSPGRYHDAADFLDLSSYDFTGNFAQSRLREVTDEGSVYMLPLAYNAMGITYNKTLLDANGWTLPTNLEELAALKTQVEDAGYVFSRCQLQYPGYGFQFLCNVADTGYLSTIEGLEWQEKFLRGETTVADTPELVESMKVMQRWVDIGMFNADGTPDSDEDTKKFVAEGNTLFLVGNSNDLVEKTDAADTYRLMPYLSEDGSQNIFLLSVSRYVGLNSALGEPGNEQKLEDALHIMEVLATQEGILSLDPTQTASRLLPLKDWVPDEYSYYIDMLDELDNGHTANLIYSGWENLALPVGEKVISYIKGSDTLDDVIQSVDENQHLVTDNDVEIYTTVTETIDTEDCARLVGVCFADAVGADAALVSYNVWRYNPDYTFKYMNQLGVSGCLFPLPVGDEELVSILPTGWRDDIQTLTLTGAQIKKLAAEGFDNYGNGNSFPYVLVTRGGMELDDTTTYTIPVCGVTDEIAEAAGGLQDSGVMGLDAARTYFSQFETLSAEDIVWE